MPLRVLVGEKQLAETNNNVVPFLDKPNEFAKYISRGNTIDCDSGDWVYVAAERRQQENLKGF